MLSFELADTEGFNRWVPRVIMDRVGGFFFFFFFFVLTFIVLSDVPSDLLQICTCTERYSCRLQVKVMRKRG